MKNLKGKQNIKAMSSNMFLTSALIDLILGTQETLCRLKQVEAWYKRQVDQWGLTEALFPKCPDRLGSSLRL